MDEVWKCYSNARNGHKQYLKDEGARIFIQIEYCDVAFAINCNNESPLQAQENTTANYFDILDFYMIINAIHLQNTYSNCIMRNKLDFNYYSTYHVS